MPGPLVHIAAMKEATRLIKKRTNYDVIVGGWEENIAPDLGWPHGWDFTKTNDGSIINKIDQCYVELVKGFRINWSNRTISNITRWLCHYLCDAHTIGQISSDYHGKKDRRFDAFAEFIYKKNKYCEYLEPAIEDLENLDDILYSSMNNVYEKYYKPAKKWYFIFSPVMVDMIRHAVRDAALFTTLYFEKAMKEAKK